MKKLAAIVAALFLSACGTTRVATEMPAVSEFLREPVQQLKPILDYETKNGKITSVEQINPQ